MATAKEVAEWMLEEMQRFGVNGLDQQHAAHHIQHRFGAEFVYLNKNGNWAIEKQVLAEFRKLTGDSVVWDRGYRIWRPRQQYDKAGRQQD